jgi:hypothetical protein
MPHGILGIFNNILYKNKFQNPQIFRRTHGPFPEQSTLVMESSLARLKKITPPPPNFFGLA